MNLLGELGATEAIEAIVRHLADNTPESGLSEWHYPAVQALHRIGEPALPAVSKALVRDPNPIARINAAQALGAIGGNAAGDALQAALATEKDETVLWWIRLQLKKQKPR